jgi:hypothetical protein
MTTSGAGHLNPDPGASDRPTGDNPSAHNLTKVTANLVPRAVAALQVAGEITGDNRTDVINRSLQVYAYLMKIAEEGKLTFVKDPATGETERLVIL